MDPDNSAIKRLWCNINRHCMLGWSGVAKVLCILRHRGVQLILAYSSCWARLAILVADKGRGGIFFFLFLLFLYFHSCSSFFHVLLFHLFLLPFAGRQHKNDPKADVAFNPGTQSI